MLKVNMDDFPPPGAGSFQDPSSQEMRVAVRQPPQVIRTQLVSRLTCQMGIKVPKGQKAWIRVGDETRRWSQGKCLLYDTTFEHEVRDGIWGVRLGC